MVQLFLSEHRSDDKLTTSEAASLRRLRRARARERVCSQSTRNHVTDVSFNLSASDKFIMNAGTNSDNFQCLECTPIAAHWQSKTSITLPYDRGSTLRFSRSAGWILRSGIEHFYSFFADCSPNHFCSMLGSGTVPLYQFDIGDLSICGKRNSLMNKTKK